MITTRLAILVTGALMAFGCTKPAKTGASAGVPARDPKAPVAKIGGQAITEGELAKESKAEISRAETQHMEKVHQIREQALDSLIEKRLIENKAKAEGLSSDQLVEREVTSKLPQPTDAELKTMYDTAKAQGQPLPPFEQIKPQIAKYQIDQNKARQRKAFIDKLRAEAKVEVLLPPLLLPKVEVALEGQSRGPSNAPITIVEFSDFQCPYCSRAEETVKKVMDTYKGKIRLFYRDYPLPFHGQAQKASEAALCAAEQNKYWEMHEKLFASQQALAVPQLKEHAKGLGLDQGKFDKCLDGGAKAKEVETSKKAGDELGVNGTPHFFINGRPLSGAQPFEEFKKVIDAELSSGG
ncbi:MAG TPA: thioredoxin domain-containing protein [Polyangia bacterium]|nr:thioredoxin domain-containing protein [Polyangia bacterium]